MRQSGTCGQGLVYGPQTLDLPRGDNTPHPPPEPRRSSAPWPTQPDRGPLIIWHERDPNRRRR